MTEKVIRKEQIYLEKTHCIERVWIISEGEKNLEHGVVNFYHLGNLIRLINGRVIPTIWSGRGMRFPGIGPMPTFWSWMISLGTGIVLVDVSLF